MEIKINLPFQQLLYLVQQLPPAQKAKLRQHLDADTSTLTDKEAFRTFLLQGPVYTPSEIAVIEENRKSITAWRTQS